MGKHREIDSAEVGNSRPSTRGSRLAFALALTALLLGTFVSFGGLAYAATQTRDAVHTIKKVTGGQKVVVHNSSATAQYNNKNGQPGKKQVFTPPSGHSPGSGGANTPQGTLPFTGLSLGGTALASGLLLLLGIMLRRRERRPT
jgi:hypothetical protein